MGAHEREILIVEDDPLGADVLCRWLKRRGYVVTIAKDGAEGVRMARARPPALVIMDFSLPVLDGLTATSELRAAPETRDIPIVMLTGHSTPGIDEACARSGADAHEEKPLNFQRLLGRIEALLGSRKSGEGS